MHLFDKYNFKTFLYNYPLYERIDNEQTSKICYMTQIKPSYLTDLYEEVIKSDKSRFATRKNMNPFSYVIYIRIRFKHS